MLYNVYEEIEGVRYTIQTGLTEANATAQVAQLEEQLAATNLQRESAGLPPISSYGKVAQ